MGQHRTQGAAGDIYTAPDPLAVADVVDAGGGWDAAMERWGVRRCKGELSRLCNEGRRLRGTVTRHVGVTVEASNAASHHLIGRGWDAAPSPRALLGLPNRSFLEA